VKLGGLFSGVGGFELAWTQLGHEVAWMCEWDAKARKVLEAKFPGVPIYPDVRDLDPAEVEAVDVLTGGSPCQGFSIAGSRSGLEHSESQLFADYVRIMDGLAARGLQYAVWENVPGVLSIKNDDGERTFAHVIGALVGAGEPVRLDPKRKWNVGLAANAGRAVAWRVLDSRYFGVAQRRRRVFACVAFGDSAADRAGRTLLAVSEGVRGDSASGQSEGEGAAGSVAASVGDKSSTGVVETLVDFGRTSDRIRIDADTAATLQAGGGGAGAKTGLYMVPQAFRKSKRAQSDTDDETWVEDGGANTLNVFDVGDTRTTHAIVEGRRDGTIMGVRERSSETYGVRRLTPVECERLQSFPDGWTEPAKSDSARYKAMGNAVTVNVVRWILGRLP
jgi:DNA (cytosine-5)-methyltransferase 1